MKIIGFNKNGNIKTCPWCGCIFEYDKDKDLEKVYKDGIDYHGAWGNTKYWAKCPNCNKDVLIKEEGDRID